MNIAYLWVALGGALGSVSRYWLNNLITNKISAAAVFPLGTMIINVTGSFLIGIFAGLAVLFVTTAPGHERVAFVLFVLQLGLLSSQVWTSTFGDGRSLIEPYLLALILLLATPKRYLSWPYLSLIAACALPALLVVARRRILHM